MKISKTLFKNLTRCKNFSALLEMHKNRMAHGVKIINGQEVIPEILDALPEQDYDSLFNEESEETLEIFDSMFDSDTGIDLTETTSAQLEAFQETFIRVEELATEYASRVFNQKLIASTNTFEQKMFSYNTPKNNYYCYLDGYMEDVEKGKIRIFEVKATTNKKYNEVCLSLRKTKNFGGEKLPLFRKKQDGCYHYIGHEYIGYEYGDKKVTEEEILKVKNKLFDRYSSVGKYIYDLAVERHIVENSFLEAMKDKLLDIVEYYLIVLNTEYIVPKDFQGDYNISSTPLFAIYNLTDITKELQEDIKIQRDALENRLSNLEYKDFLTGSFCEYKKTTQCKYFNICFRSVLKPKSVLEFLDRSNAFSSPNLVNNKRERLNIYDMINNGFLQISDCFEYITKQKNIVQYNCSVSDQEYYDSPVIEKSLRQIQYPIFHLDFESYNSPLPRFFGENPYMQSLFQYSLHIERTPGVCDLEKDHYEYLAPDHMDHREDLIKHLIQDIDLSNGGCVMVYNKSFEKTRLKELARIFPAYKKELDTINDAIFDLLEILNGSEKFYGSFLSPDMLEKFLNGPKFTFYSNELHGSFSIKKVLPIFTNLTYKNLEVKNGTEAILTYGLLAKLSDKEYKEKYQALRVYCRQDTWAMVEILRGLRKIKQG